MIVKSVQFRGYKGFRIKAEFNPIINVFVGQNGSGKTTMLDVIAGMSGSDFATKLIANAQVEYAHICLEHEGKEYNLTVEGRFHEDQIVDFKSRLPERSSYVVRERDDYRFTGKLDDGLENQTRTLDWLETADMPLDDRQLAVSSNKASLLVSETGAQRNMLNIGFRLPPAQVPLLMDGLEQSLHIMSRRIVMTRFYRKSGQQLIGTTHCPEIMAAAEGTLTLPEVFSMEKLYQ